VAETCLRSARQARAGIREVRRILVTPTPEMLDLCQPFLTEAIARLKEIESAIRAGKEPGTRHLRAELGDLRKDLAQVNALLAQAAAFHSGWVRLLATITEGYDRKGEPGQRPPIRRISMEG